MPSLSLPLSQSNTKPQTTTPILSSKKSKDGVFNQTLDNLLTAYCLERADTSNGNASSQKLKQSIVTHVQPFVVKLAKGLARRAADPVDDLIQVGCIGLLKALDKFNPLSGSSFKTYSTYLITGEIRHYLRDKGSMIKSPRPLYELYYRMNVIIQQLSEALGRTPNDEEIAEALQCPVEKVSQAQDAERRRQPVSLDQFYVGENTDGETMFVERLVDNHYEQFVSQREDFIVLKAAMAQLTPQLQEVVQLTYFEDLTQSDIAERLGVSQMQISRRHRKAIAQLTHSFTSPHSERP
jgi:RNA polymerase sigma-B factor